jgi:class 3 adenylate cyclase
MKKEITLVIIAFLLIFGFVSAKIFVEETSSVYSLGDRLILNAVMEEESNVNDYFTANLICGDNNVEIYKTPYSVESGVTKDLKIDLVLDNFIFKDSKGDCFVKLSYNGQSINTERFIISRNIMLTINSQDYVVNPGSVVEINGNAIKENKVGLSGFVTASIKSTDIYSDVDVSEGNFSVNLSLDSDMAAGDYKILLKAYDVNSKNEVLNQKSIEADLTVLQVPTSLDIALSNVNGSVDDNVTAKFFVYDQSGIIMEDGLKVELIDPNGSIRYNGVVSTLDSFVISIDSNFTPGDWKVVSKLDDLYFSRIFTVSPSERLSYSVNGNKLLVKNLGNVAYNKEVQLEIGGELQTFNVDLGLNEEKTFVLSAPEGNYDISVSDNSGKKVIGSSYLTGNAISVSEDGILNSGKSLLFLFWIVVILALSIIGVYLYRRVQKKKFYGYSPSEGKTEKVKSTTNNISMAHFSGHSRRGSSVIEHGEKQVCSIIALKIKNSDEVRNSVSNALESIEFALSPARDSGAKIISDGDYHVVIFSPSLTSKMDNSLDAVRVAQSIENKIKDHNKKFSQKINFGIGINIGELVVELGSGEFAFAPMGNTIIMAKKLASSSNQEVLLSESARNKTLSSVKAEKVSDNSWRILRFVERNKSSEFIEKFMKRQSGK